MREDDKKTLRVFARAASAPDARQRAMRRSDHAGWERLPPELRQLVVRWLLCPRVCTLASMRAAWSLAACSKGANRAFGEALVCLRSERRAGEGALGDVLFELDVESWRWCTRARPTAPDSSGASCPCRVGFRATWVRGVRPGLGLPLAFHVLLASRGRDWGRCPLHAHAVDSRVASIAETSYHVNGSPRPDDEGRIVVHCPREVFRALPDALECEYGTRVVAKSDALVAFMGGCARPRRYRRELRAASA